MTNAAVTTVLVRQVHTTFGTNVLEEMRARVYISKLRIKAQSTAASRISLFLGFYVLSHRSGWAQLLLVSSSRQRIVRFKGLSAMSLLGFRYLLHWSDSWA